MRDLPLITDQTAFNLDRWDELCADPLWLGVEGKIETDRYGQVIVHPPAEYSHGSIQADLGILLAQHAPPGGKGAFESPISTSAGVKVADVTWASAKRLAKIAGRTALSAAPEICVEVLSPGNTRNEIEDKRRLYFEAGAQEVWICERDGVLRFFLKTAPAKPAAASKVCPGMPGRIEE
ncbi:MAG TPA: Uma2 family endonuclease [Chthoniobacteraceae bacterium]|nr:Uma2 family endonuclease [Chthoniobacteraceae bacterium]